MTAPEPTTDLERQLLEENTSLRGQVRQLDDRMIAERNSYEGQLASLRQQLAPLAELEQITAERNNLRTQLSETEQERARLYGVLQDTVQGVQSWAPDLTPVPAPPPELEPAVAEAWVRDQIAQRRATWDQFVHRVVTQANV